MSDPFDTRTIEENDSEHERIYKKFVRLARAAAFAIPFFVIFLLMVSQ